MRKWLLFCHRWAGMSVGLAMVFVASTGSLLAFRAYLEPVILGQSCAEQMPLDDLVNAGRAVHPGTVDSLRIYPDSPRAADLKFGRDDLFLDSCTGKLLGLHGQFGGFFNAAEHLHRWMFLADFETVAGSVASLCFFLIVVAGLTVWWPRTRGALKRLLVPNFRLRGFPLLLNLHKCAGSYAVLALLLLTMTGQWMAFDWIQEKVFGLQGAPKASTGAQNLPLEELWGRARPNFTAPQEVLIRPAKKPGAPVRMLVIEADSPHSTARDDLFIDPQSGEIIKFTPYAKASLGFKLYNWGVALHTGQAGILTSLLIFLGAISVPVLACTGILSYLKRPSSK